MNVTIFIGGLSGGGAERVVCNLANYLNNHNNNVEILTMSDDRQSYNINLDIKRVPLITHKERKNAVYNTLLRFYRLCKYMKRSERDCYVVFLPVTTIMMLMLRSATNAKIIASERADPASYSKRIQKLLRHFAKRVDGYVFQTEDAQLWYGDSIKNASKIVIPNAINEEFIRPQYKGPKKKEIVAVGRLKQQKNFSLLIMAYSKIISDYPDYTLAIYGEGEKRTELQALVDNLGIQDKVAFNGYTDGLANKIEVSAVFVLSSNYEGMPNALMEAMALGLPCISTDCPCGGPRYLIQDGYNGLLVPVGDVQSLEKAMRKILSNQEFAKKCGQAARSLCSTLHPAEIYGKWENYLYSVLENPKI